jgi:hypothetical protein
MEQNLTNRQENEIREWLARRCGRADIPDPTWEILMIRGHVFDAWGSQSGKEELLEAGGLLLTYGDFMEGTSSARPSRTTRKEHATRRPPELDRINTERMEDRVEALSEFLAFRAAAHRFVQETRQIVLGGRVLGEEEALAFVDSPAAARFSLEWFAGHEIPVVEHAARLLLAQGADLIDDDPNRIVEFDFTLVDPPGDVFEAPLPESVAYEDLERLQCWGPRPVFPGSVLDGLRRVAKELVDEFCGAWSEDQVTRFILTGEVGVPKALVGQVASDSSEHLTYGTITIEAQPWVSPGVIAEAYRNLQQQVLERKPRAVSSGNLAVFGFVIRQMRNLVTVGEGWVEAQELTWDVLMERWNRANPKQLYFYESQFRRDFDRAAIAVRWPFDPFGAEFSGPVRIPAPE